MTGANVSKHSPEEFLDLIRKEKRGKLKVYLGSAAGVGKTFRMLAEGKILKQNGVDVVIGYMEPHERPETIAQAEGLETVSPLVVKHENLTLKELDVDAVLKRHPKVALVDELAHSNAQGMRHWKRYEDVQELLDAGISVITTLNVQHLESLYNIIEDATGVRVAERIPDSIVGKADFIIDVDLEAEDLIERLKAGKIYRLDRIDAALNNFFTVKNLTRLREITLAETAKLLDLRQRELPTAKTKPSSHLDVLYVLTGEEENPGTMLRKTKRFADQLNAAWYVLHVSTLEMETHPLDPRRKDLEKAIELAKRMGAQVVTVKDEDIPSAVTQFARANGITHIIVDRPKPRTWRNMFEKTYFDQLAQNLPEVDIVVG
jgi:two-component system sensor histidine kinase KdpD